MGGLSPLIKWGIASFQYFIEGEGKRIGHMPANFSLNPSISFHILGGMFSL
jgi:uncharacterized protein (DUF486 family)